MQSATVAISALANGSLDENATEAPIVEKGRRKAAAELAFQEGNGRESSRRQEHAAGVRGTDAAPRRTWTAGGRNP